MRTIQEIRADLARATEHRGELWEELGHGLDQDKSAEARRLSSLIDDLWAELRTVKAHRGGAWPELIQRRARAEERPGRDTRRARKAAWAGGGPPPAPPRCASCSSHRCIRGPRTPTSGPSSSRSPTS